MASGAAPSWASPVLVVHGCPAPLNPCPLPGQLWAGSGWVMEQERLSLFPPRRWDVGAGNAQGSAEWGRGPPAAGFDLYEPLKVTSKRTAGQPKQVSLPLKGFWTFSGPSQIQIFHGRTRKRFSRCRGGHG